MLTAGVVCIIQQDRMQDLPSILIIGLLLSVPMAIGIVCIWNARQKFTSAINELRQIQKNPLLAWLPEAYRNSLAYDYFKKIITEGQADSIIEAIIYYTKDPGIAFIRKMQFYSVFENL